MHSLEFVDIIGITGVGIVIITYFLLQIERISAESLSYSLLNAFGSLLIIVSLLENWNLASFLIEICWILISLIGIVKAFKRRINKKEPL